MRVLFAVRKGNEEWQEELITERAADADVLRDATEWAKTQGFHRFRTVEFSDQPDDSFINDFKNCTR